MANSKILNWTEHYRETGELKEKTKDQLLTLFEKADRGARAYWDCHDGSFEQCSHYNGRDALIDEWRERGYPMAEILG